MRETYPRSLAREVAFQFLYQNELNPRSDSSGGPIRWQDVDLPRLTAFARQMFEILQRSMHEDPDGIERAVDMLSLSRYLERMADHATNIAEDIVFQIEGEVIRHVPEDEL